MDLNDLKPKDYWIPIKGKGDMFAPTSEVENDISVIYKNIDGTNEVRFWTSDLLDEDEHIDETSIFMAIGNLLYVFNMNEETVWFRYLDSDVEGYECIPALNIVSKDLIPYFFKLVNGGYNYNFDRYKELSLLLIGCTNTELCNTILTFEEFIKEVSDIIGYKFEFDVKEI